jgi:tetratricopeptide (TPR) repeat protein
MAGTAGGRGVTGGEGGSAADRVLRWAAFVLVAAPSLLLGCARPDLRLAALAGAAALAVAFSAMAVARGRRVAFGAEAGLLAAAGLLSLLQAVPWGGAVASALGGPGAARAASSLESAGLPGPWPFLSQEPLASLEGGAYLLVMAVVLVTLAGLARDRAARPGLLAAVAAAGVAQVAVGLAGLAAGTPLRALFIDAPLASTPGFHGTFLNDNHTASLLLLSVFACLALAGRWEGRRRAAARVAAAVLALAVVATGSRGGATALWVAGLVVAVARWRAGRGPAPAATTPALRALLAAGLVLAAAVAALAVDQWLFRYADRSWWPDAWAGKTRAWGPALRMIADHPWAGTGRGSFATALTAYNDAGPQWTYDAVENLPLQALADWGIPAGTALLLAGLLLGVRLLAALPGRPTSLAALVGVGAVVAKDFGDFALGVPGVALPALALLAVAMGGRRRPAGSSRTSAGPASGRLALAASLAVALLLVPSVPGARRDREVLRAPLAALATRAAAGGVAAGEVDDALAAAVRLHPVDAEAFRLAAVADLASGRPEPALRRADQALVLDPWSVPAALAGLQAARDAGHAEQVARRTATLLDRRPDADARAFTLLQAGDWPVEAVLAGLSGVPGALDRYLDFLARDRQGAAAARLLEARLRKDPRDVAALARLGTLLLDGGDLAGGEQAAVRVLALAPDGAEGWFLSGRAAWGRGALLEALALFQEAAARSPDPFDANFQALRCLLMLDRRDEFDALARQVESRIGTDPYRRASLEQVLASRSARRGAFEAALGHLDRAESLVPWAPDVRLARAYVRRDAGDREGALRETLRTLALDPAYPPALELRRMLEAPGAVTPREAPPPGP